MIAITAAFAAIKARAEANISGVPMFWQDGGNHLPDKVGPFIYFELLIEGASPIEIGGGRGANRHRNTGELNIYVFDALGVGLSALLARAEPIAAVFRGWRGDGVSIPTASVHPLGEGESLTPPGMDSVAGNYVAVVVHASLYFDQKA